MIRETEIPNDALLISKSFDFADCFFVSQINKEYSCLEIYEKATKDLKFLNILFFLRDKISSIFGIKPIQGFKDAKTKTISVKKQKVDFFDLEGLADDLMILVNRDKHLDVMIFLQLKPSNECNDLFLTTSVKTHNKIGLIYLKIVKIFHKSIVRFILRNLLKTLKTN